MYSNKRFLLIAGDGTLGTYVSEELLRLGAFAEDGIRCELKKLGTQPNR